MSADESQSAITSEHLRLRFDALIRRVGMQAIIDSTQQADVQRLALESMTIEQQRTYLAELMSLGITLNDDIDDVQDDILDETRERFDTIDGYFLGSVDEAAIHLVRGVTDRPELFRPEIRLSYDDNAADGQKYTKRLLGSDRSYDPWKHISEPQSVMEDDHRTIAAAFDKLRMINETLKADLDS